MTNDPDIATPTSLAGVVTPVDLDESPLEHAQRIAREALEANTARIAELRQERTTLNEKLIRDRDALMTAAKDRRAALNDEIGRLRDENKGLSKIVPSEDE